MITADRTVTVRDTVLTESEIAALLWRADAGKRAGDAQLTVAWSGGFTSKILLEILSDEEGRSDRLRLGGSRAPAF